MNAIKLNEKTQYLISLERMIKICSCSGGPIKVSQDGWNGEQWIESCLVNTVKVAIKEIYEQEAKIIREWIKEMVALKDSGVGE